MIIDIHVHCFPNEVAPQAIASRSQRFRLAPLTDGTVKGLQNLMAETGIDLSVAQPIAAQPQQTIKMNRWAASSKEEGVISFGTIHPDFLDWKQEIKWLAGQGIKGVKFHADCQGYYVDDRHMLAIYEAIFEAGLIILFHSGADRAFAEPFHCTPSRLRKVLDTFPGSPIIAAHMGGYKYWDDVEKYLLGQDVYLDTAYSIHEMGLEKTQKFIKRHGPEKVLFGTDSPWRHQAQDIALLRKLELKDEDLNAILGNNAKKLLGIA